MKIIKKKGLILEDYEDEFSYKQSKSGLSISFNRIAFIFFVFIIISIIFSSKAIYLGSLELESKKINLDKTDYRASIVDRSGNILAKTIMMTNVGINPNLVINKKNLILNLKLIFPNKNFDEVIKKANNQVAGLASYVCTSSIELANKTSEALETGMVAVNTPFISNAETPFGGIKQSGYGREGGSVGIKDYLNIKYTHLGITV